MYVLVLGLAQGCGEPRAPVIGPNLALNGSFESGLESWWVASGSPESTATVSPEAADHGAHGLVLHNGLESWGSMVGQDTELPIPGQTYHLGARLRGAVGGERVTFLLHGQSFEVLAEAHWSTVSGMVVTRENGGNSTARISLSTQGATVHVDDVSIAKVEVERGEADTAENNLLLNGSFESGLGLWALWTDSPGAGGASTSPEARRSGYAGLVLSQRGNKALTTVKQTLPEPLAEGEEYSIQAQIRGAKGAEKVTLCLQRNREPWDGPCTQVLATEEWKRVSVKLSVEPALHGEQAGLLIALGSDGTVHVDDVVVARTQKP